jgi:hypothetical protein
MHPDRQNDIIVQHVKAEAAREECWSVFVGTAKRADLPTAERAFVFARLLADVQQRRAWVAHGIDAELTPLEHAALRGCSCC